MPHWSNARTKFLITTVNGHNPNLARNNPKQGKAWEVIEKEVNTMLARIGKQPRTSDAMKIKYRHLVWSCKAVVLENVRATGIAEEQDKVTDMLDKYIESENSNGS